MKLVLENNEFTSTLNEIRELNLKNKKTYTLLYRKIEELITPHSPDENQKAIKEFLEQKNQINRNMSKITGLTYSLENRFLEFKSIIFTNLEIENFLSPAQDSFNLVEITQIQLEEFKKITNSLAPVITDKDGKIIKLTPINAHFRSLVDSLNILNNKIEETLDQNVKNLESIKNNLLNNMKIIKENINLDYQTRFREETSLILKKYENEIKNLTNKFENQIKIFKLDQEKINKSSTLLLESVNTGLKDLAYLNERIQKVELEFSKIINIETENIKSELNGAKINITDEVSIIINDVTEKSKAIETAHADFIALVESAGIYELTKNYKTKADEEKKDYRFFSWATIISIILAIITTIIVIAIPIVEHWKANPPVDANYYTIMARLTISFMFFILAVYTSKQASKHYECYQENHRTFLQLAALEPFMARMNPEEQKEIRKGLIPSYFNQANDGKYSSKGDEVDLSTNATSIINNLIDKFGSKGEQSGSAKSETKVE